MWLDCIDFHNSYMKADNIISILCHINLNFDSLVHSITMISLCISITYLAAKFNIKFYCNCTCFCMFRMLVGGTLYLLYSKCKCDMPM